MFKFIKNCFNEIKIGFNVQEFSGGKKVLTLIFCAFVLVFVLAVYTVLYVSLGTLMLCILPVGLLCEGIKYIVGLAKDLYKSNQRKKEKTKEYNKQMRQIEKNYNQKCESINDTMELLENSKSIVQDELGEEVVAQELVPIALEDIEAYIQYIASINKLDASLLSVILASLIEKKEKLDKTINREERNNLECEYSNIMFKAQDIIGNYVEEINSMNANFDKSPKKRRLYN